MFRRLIVVRHGDRCGSYSCLGTNDMDPGLSSAGEKQASETGNWLLKYHPIQQIIVAPALRTIQTAQIINTFTKCSITVDFAFTEWMPTDWFSRDPRALWIQNSKNYTHSLPLENQLIFPETLSDLYKRVRTGTEQLKRSTQGVVILVTHGVIAECIGKIFLGKTIPIPAGLCSVSEYLNNKGHIEGITLGYCGHLSDGEKRSEQLLTTQKI